MKFRRRQFLHLAAGAAALLIMMCFSELATTPGMTVGALTVALTTPHAGMPMFMLTADQKQDVIAYILGLR